MNMARKRFGQVNRGLKDLMRGYDIGRLHYIRVIRKTPDSAAGLCKPIRHLMAGEAFAQIYGGRAYELTVHHVSTHLQLSEPMTLVVPGKSPNLNVLTADADARMYERPQLETIVQRIEERDHEKPVQSEVEFLRIQLLLERERSNEPCLSGSHPERKKR